MLQVTVGAASTVPVPNSGTETLPVAAGRFNEAEKLPAEPGAKATSTAH